MAGYNQREFVQALMKSPEARTPHDLKLIYSYMHVLEAVSSLKEANIRALCKTVRYERHDADDILYWRAQARELANSGCSSPSAAAAGAAS